MGQVPTVGADQGIGSHSMAETLRRLVNLGSYSLLQEKLEQWLDSYKVSMFTFKGNGTIWTVKTFIFNSNCSGSCYNRVSRIIERRAESLIGPSPAVAKDACRR